MANPDLKAVDQENEHTNKQPFQTEPMPVNQWNKSITQRLRQSKKSQKYIQTQKRMAQINISINLQENQSPREAHQNILKKIATEIGSEKIDALYITNNGKIVIAAKSEKHLDDLIKAKIAVEGNIMNITPVIKRSLLITLDCPFYIDDEEITEELEQFSTIQSKVLYETYSWANTIKSGKWKIYVSPNIDILDVPHYVRLDGRKYTIYYKEKGFFCKYCGKNKPHDHKCEDIDQQDIDIGEEIAEVKKVTTSEKNPVDEQHEPIREIPPEAPQPIRTPEIHPQPITKQDNNNNNNNKTTPKEDVTTTTKK